MSHKATNWAVEQRGLKPIAKVLLWHLADCHNPVLGCFPTQEYLAERCEISRASVNRYLVELEEAGLIARTQRVNEQTKRQLPTRYILAFEDGFEPLDVDTRVSGLDTASDTTRVSENGQAVSQDEGVAVSQSSETLTSKITSNLTGKASERVSNDVLWGAYPHRPMDNRTRFDAAIAAMTDAETGRLLVAVKRYFQWHVEDAEGRGVTPEAQLEYRPAMAKWVISGAWIDALTVPLKSDPAPATVDGVVYLAADHPDFKAVERMLGKTLPIFAASGRRPFRIEEIEQARQSGDMGERQAS